MLLMQLDSSHLYLILVTCALQHCRDSYGSHGGSLFHTGIKFVSPGTEFISPATEFISLGTEFISPATEFISPGWTPILWAELSFCRNKLRSCESNSVSVQMNYDSVSRTQFLCKKASLRGLRRQCLTRTKNRLKSILAQSIHVHPAVSRWKLPLYMYTVYTVARICFTSYVYLPMGKSNQTPYLSIPIAHVGCEQVKWPDQMKINSNS